MSTSCVTIGATATIAVTMRAAAITERTAAMIGMTAAMIGVIGMSVVIADMTAVHLGNTVTAATSVETGNLITAKPMRRNEGSARRRTLHCFGIQNFRFQVYPER